MEMSAMEGISERLASIEGLYFPGAIRSGAPDPSQRKTALLDLLSRDAPIFLERYGGDLTGEELREFEILHADYEVQFHLNRLRRRRDPTEAEARARSATVKNRRLAYMERLIGSGDYFTEDAMREREPYLHHEYVGRFQDPSGRSLPRPGERWSETLLRRWEEATLVEKIRAEQQRLGVDRREWVGDVGEQEEEEEEEEEEEDDEVEEEEEDEVEEEGKDGLRLSKVHADHDLNGSAQGTVTESHEQAIPMEEMVHADHDSNGCAQGSVAESHEQAIPTEEMEYQLEQFTQIMQQKFLAGEDTEHLDYSKIDDDEGLDDHWLREANLDAEEKYFDEE